MHTLQRHVALVTLACLLLLLGACSREERAADPAQATTETGNGPGIVQYTIEQFMDSTTYVGASFSPDNSRILVSNNSTGIFNVYAIPVDASEPVPLTRSTADANLGDVVASKQLLIDTGVVAPDRIGIIGGSYGGYMVLAALAFEPEEFAVGVDIFAVANWVRTLENTPPWWGAQRDSLFAEMGDPGIPRSLSQGGRPIVTASNGCYSRAAQDWSGGGATP